MLYIRGLEYLLKTRERVLCRAPFANLYINPNGDVFCCFANKNKLGSILEKPLKEIFYNEKLKTIRENVLRIKLDKYCGYCKNKILERNIKQVYAYRYRFLDANYKNPVLKSLELQLYNDCNANCVMCVVSKEKYKRLSIDFILKEIEPLIIGLKNISLSGGEPFYIKKYYDLIEYILKKNPNIIISINTNGSIYNEEVEELLNKGKFNITVSIDSINSSTFENIRKGLSFSSIYENLFKFKNYVDKKGTSYNVKTCILKENIYELFDLFVFFEKLGIYIILNEVFYPIEHSLYSLPSFNLKKILNFLDEKDIYKSSNLGLKNYSTWLELKKLIKKYYVNAKKFENFLNNKKNLDKTIQKILNKIEYEVLKDYYFNNVLISDKTKKLKFLKLLITAPLERLIPEIEYRSNEMFFLLDDILMKI